MRYAGASIADPTTTQTGGSNPLSESSLSPLTNPGAPGSPVQGGGDVNLNLNIIFNTTDLKFHVNNATFTPPSLPVLLQILNGASAQDLLPSGSVYVLPKNQTVEVSMPGGSTGSPVSLI